MIISINFVKTETKQQENCCYFVGLGFFVCLLNETVPFSPFKNGFYNLFTIVCWHKGPSSPSWLQRLIFTEVPGELNCLRIIRLRKDKADFRATSPSRSSLPQGWVRANASTMAKTTRHLFRIRLGKNFPNRLNRVSHSSVVSLTYFHYT